MLVYYDGGRRRYVCKSLYTERDLPKSAGFRWDPQGKVWWTDRDANALKLVDYADLSTKLHLKILFKDQSKSLKLSRATDANIEIPAPEGLHYLPFQKAGVAYALSRSAVLIGDEMGLGKTIQAIGVINVGEKPGKVLIICPASLKGNWKREFAKWSTHRLSIGIAAAKEPWPPDHVVIVNYDILDRFEKELSSQFDYLIVDECHYLKNPKAKRTIHVLGSSRQRTKKGMAPAVQPITARKRLFMTGTPIVNRPKELWPIIHSLDPVKWSSFFKYAMRYCGAYNNGWGWDFSGSSNLGELQTILRSTILVRRLKSEVLKELPDKIRQVIELPSNGSKKLIEAEWEEWRGHKDKVEELQKRIEDAAVLKDVEAYREAVQALRSEMVIAFSSMAQVRHDTAVSKIPMVVEHLTNVLESGNKVVVFAWHKDVILEIKKEVEHAAEGYEGKEVRKMVGVKGSKTKGENEDGDVQVYLRTGEGSTGAKLGRGKVKRVPSVPPEKTRKELHPRIQYVSAGEAQGEATGSAFQDDDRGHQNTKAMPSSRDSYQDRGKQKSLFDEPIVGQDPSFEGIHKGKRVGNKLESERDQTRRVSEGAGEDRKKSSNSRGHRVVITGDVSLPERQIAVDRFQNDPSCRMIIGTIGAMGVGITLTAASHVIFAELDWVPGNVSQAEDRLHRIGQKDSVLVQHLVLEDSLDAHMAKVIVKKQEVIEKALDKEAIAVPREKKSLLVTMSNPAKESSIEKAYKAPPKKNLASAPTWYSSSDVLEALRILSERCDGARSLDGNGFNKFDTAFGKDLASRNFLTPGQAEAGIKLVRKYRKQLPERIREKLNLVQKAGV